MSCRRFLFHWCALLMFVVLFAECASFLTLRVMTGEWFSLRAIDEVRSKTLPANIQTGTGDISTDLFFAPLRLSLHPYLGYVQDPKSDGVLSGSSHEPLDAFGFGSGLGTFVRERDPDEMVIGIFGGSLAHAFAVYGDSISVLADALKKDPRFRGKYFTFAPVALGGYKQPQQLLALTYLLSLGAQFDMVIDISGFNEIALPLQENIPAGVHPLYPRSWQVLSGNISPKRMQFLGKLSLLYSLRERIAVWSRIGLCDKSHSCSIVWLSLHQLLSRSIERNTAALQSHDAAGTSSYVLKGPQEISTDPAEELQNLVDAWKRSTLLMHELGRAHGIRMFTFLQPNPYFGVKPFSSQEKAVLQPGNWADTFVTQGYPLLQDATQHLRTAGIDAVDLTGIFHDSRETIYVDACCHIGLKGNHILAQALAREILQRW